jgi:hypothetical protein
MVALLHDVVDLAAATSPISEQVALAAAPSPTSSTHLHHLADISFPLIYRSEAERSARRVTAETKAGQRKRKQIRGQFVRQEKGFLFSCLAIDSFRSCSIQEMHVLPCFF